MPPNALKPVKSIRPFAVTCTITRKVNFVVDARTPEEAESICEDWIEDGETGTVSETSVEFEDIYPTEDEASNNPLNRSLFPAEFD